MSEGEDVLTQTFHVVIEKHIPLRTYSKTVIWSGFVKSESESAEEVKQSILNHHKKKGLKGLEVTVTKSGDLEDTP